VEYSSQRAVLIRKSEEGELLDRFLREGSYDVLNKLILIPLEEAAFKAFSQVNPSELHEVIQTQKMAQIIREIRSTIESKVAEGRLAAHQLKTLPEDSSDE
jgi:hypothetical protein